MITLGATSSKNPAQGLGQMLIIAPLKATRLLMAKSVLISAPNEARSTTGVIKNPHYGAIVPLTI